MLSGIRKGKKAKKAKDVPPPEEEATSAGLAEPPNELLSQQQQQQQRQQEHQQRHSQPSSTTTASFQNQSIADQLRQSLASGDTSLLSSSSPSAAKQLSLPSSGVIDQLERRGRILKEGAGTTTNDDNDNSDIIVLDMPGSSSSNRIGGRGGGGGSTTTNNNVARREDEMSIRELAKHEARTAGLMSWDEEMTRNVLRVGKKRKLKLKSNAKNDSDDEVEQLKKLLPDQEQHHHHHEKHLKAKTVAQMDSRDRHRQVAHHHQQEKITAKCSWWLESSSFAKHRLLALGNHVTLVMAPPNASLVAGHHFYLVPIKHAESFVSCDDNDNGGDAVWDEVRRFHTSLSNLYAKEYKKGIILCETVLPQNGVWQTRLEVVPVPFSALQDAPLYFKSAMMEQTEEWGTHNQLLPTTSQKPLKAVVPKKKFPYFYVEWGNVATSPTTGCAQIIESSDFRHDFGVDTLAGMMKVDPIRFQRKRKFSHEEEQQGIATFLEKWKHHDWTLQLDNE
jgi:hypothetical protein